MYGLGATNCGWWSLPGSACYAQLHPGEDGTIGCALGLTTCLPAPPVLRSAGPPPPIGAGGRAPADYSVEDVAGAGAAQNAGVLSNWWNSLPVTPDAAPGQDWTTVALVVAAVAVASMFGGR